MAYFEHLKDNKYKLCVRDPSKVGRKRVYSTVIVPPEIARSERKTKHWLDLELAKFVEQVESGQLIRSDKISFRNFVPQWKKGYASQNMGGNTIRNVMGFIDTHLMPVFGDSRMDHITTLQLVTFFADLKRKDGKPMAANTKLNIYKAAKSIFDAAFEWKVIGRNPIDGVQRPSQSKKEKKAIRSKKQAYSWDEVETLITALYSLPNRWRLYFTGVMLGGFRRGEMLAVEWFKCDFEHAAIYIDTQITLDEEGNKTEGEVKTDESEDWVAMPRWYMDELKAYKKEWNKEKLNSKDWHGGDKQYIFHSGAGEMYYPSTPTGTWREFLQKHNLPHVKLHGLRHTAGMLLRNAGTDLKTIQERLRHTKIGTTMDIYTHKSSQIQREAADRLEDLNPKKPKNAPWSAPSSE